MKRFTACRIVWRQNIHFYQKDQSLDTKDDQISVNVRVKWPRELFGKEGCVCTREILKKCSKLDNWNRSNCLCVVGKYKRSNIIVLVGWGSIHSSLYLLFFFVCWCYTFNQNNVCRNMQGAVEKKMAEATSINSDEFANFSFTPPRPRGRLRSFSRSHRSKYYAMTPNISASKKFGSNTSLTSYGKCLLPSQFHLSTSTHTAL